MFGVYQCGRGSVPPGLVVVKRGNGRRRRFEAWGVCARARVCALLQLAERPLSTRARLPPRWMSSCQQLTRGPCWPFWADALRCPPGGGEPLVSGEHLLPCGAEVASSRVGQRGLSRRAGSAVPRREAEDAVAGLRRQEKPAGVGRVWSPAPLGRPLHWRSLRLLLAFSCRRCSASPPFAGLGPGASPRGSFVAGSRAGLGIAFLGRRSLRPSPGGHCGGIAAAYVWGTPPPLGNHVQIAGFVRQCAGTVCVCVCVRACQKMASSRWLAGDSRWGLPAVIKGRRDRPLLAPPQLK